MRKYHLTVLVLLGAVVLVIAPTAQARGRDLVVSVRADGVVTQLGPMHPGPLRSAADAERRATYRAAVKAFGHPGALRRRGKEDCAARWFRYGLRIELVDYSSRVACVDGGWIQVASMTSRRWVTDEGLRIGDGLADLRDLYPDAERHGSKWWLVRAYSEIGEPGWYGALTAVVHGGTVTGFVAWVGAGGD